MNATQVQFQVAVVTHEVVITRFGQDGKMCQRDVTSCFNALDALTHRDRMKAVYVRDGWTPGLGKSSVVNQRTGEVVTISIKNL